MVRARRIKAFYGYEPNMDPKKDKAHGTMASRRTANVDHGVVPVHVPDGPWIFSFFGRTRTAFLLNCGRVEAFSISTVITDY